MAAAKRLPLWTTDAPAAWPDAPAEMTVTTLAEIEACPRRWALSAAEYRGIWNGRGYPPRVQMSALAGTIVHLALETITRELVRVGCSSVKDPKAPQVMRDLGGYTKVVHDCCDRVLHRLANNPRAMPLLEYASRLLRSQAPEFRVRAQVILCRVCLPGLPAASANSGRSKLSGPLMGAFPEIELCASRIGWKGKADLLVISDDACEITDFKTGAQDERHRFQIQVYALLWSRDEELNPRRRRVDRLVLRYGGEDVDIAAPTAAQLDDIERHIVARRNTAHLAVSQRPPEARPNAENCRYCAVRHLCDRYWVAATQRERVAHVGNQRFSDVELTVIGRHGPSSWDAVVESSPQASLTGHAVLRTKGNVEFRTGDRLRVIDAVVAFGDDEQPLVFTLSALSETYLVP